MEQHLQSAYDSIRDFQNKGFRSACYAPFVSLFFTGQGSVLACCKNGSYVLGDVRTDRLKQIWNSEKIQRLRTALSEYKFHQGCSFCEWEIQGGNFRTATPLMFDQFAVEARVPEWPSLIEFEGSNTCNFECIMCNGYTSSSIRTHRDGLPAIGRIYPDSFFEDLRPFLPHLKRARFFGGEPFLTQEAHRIWDMMIDEGVSTVCDVTTNGSQFNSKVERVLQALPFHLVVSIDGATKETVEKIRINCRYEQLIENIKRFQTYTIERRTSFHLAFCLMRQNCHEFGDLLLFAEDLGIEVFVNTVIDPSYCSLYTLPRHELAEKILKLERKGEDLLPRLKLNRKPWEEALLKLRSAAQPEQRAKMAMVLSEYYVPDDALHGAIECVKQGLYQDALREAGQVPSSDASWYFALALSGYARSMLGDLQGADQDLDQAVALSGRRPEAFLHRARIRARQKKWKEAYENAKRAKSNVLPEDRLDFETSELLAYLHLRRGKLLRAIKDLTPIVRLQFEPSEIQALSYPLHGTRGQLWSEVERRPGSMSARLIRQFFMFVLWITGLSFRFRYVATGRIRKTGLRWKNLIRKMKARIFRRYQLSRLSFERLSAKFASPNRFRILATACWNFPVYSQTFVYQELTQLIRKGFRLKFLYGKLATRDQLPGQFDPLWKARLRYEFHPSVCKLDYEHYLRRMPDKVAALVQLLCDAAAVSAEELKKHHHFMEAFAFTRLVEAYGPDYIHSYFFYEGTLFSLVASYLLDIPRGVSCYADHMLNDYPFKVVPLHLDQCSFIISTSEQIKQELLKIFPGANQNRLLVKPNAINAAQFPAKKNYIRKNDEPYRLVTVSRIEPKKGLIYLVEAIHLLRERGMKVELHIIGEADNNSRSRQYAEKLKETIENLSLQKYVHLEDRKTEQEIGKFFEASQIFVAPFIQTEYGDKDGIPTSLLEGMSAGLPIVGTNAGSIPEVVEDGIDGLLVPQKDAQALADGIMRIARDNDLGSRLGTQAARKIREKFDVQICEEKFHHKLSKFLALERVINSNNHPKPLVSIITAFYNAEDFLAQAIESVLGQSYVNWELLLIDDGSSDGSSAIARRFEKQHPGKIRYFTHDDRNNHGAAASRNLGLTHARGKYIALLDADDVWLAHKLRRQMAILQSQPSACMIFGASRYWHGWTGNAGDASLDHTPDLGVETEKLYVPGDLTRILYPLGSGAAPCPSDLLLRREAFEAGAAFEDQFTGDYQLYEDQAFLAKIYLKRPVFISSEYWDNYRVHEHSCMSRVHGSGRYEAVRNYYLRWFDSYLKKEGIVDDRIQVLVASALEKLKPPANESSDKNSRVAANNGSGVHWGNLRRITPVSREWGFDRGLPIDRYYIEKFLSQNAESIQGHVLELKDIRYTKKFGGERVIKSDVLHAAEGNPEATIVADLAAANHIPTGAFDCFIFTQALHLIYDFRAAVRTIYRILKPGGVLLATFPGISRVSFDEFPDSYLWMFTASSSQRLFEEVFGPENLRIEACGNVLAAVSFLHGLAAEELSAAELDNNDPLYQVLIAVRAVKPDVGVNNSN